MSVPNYYMVRRLTSKTGDERNTRSKVTARLSINSTFFNENTYLSEPVIKALFDSCHSGTILDLPYERSWGPRSKSPPLLSSPVFTAEPTCESPTLPTVATSTKLYYDNLEEEGTPIESVPQSPTERAHLTQLARKGPLGKRMHGDPDTLSY
jgi:hypothetical protein